MDWSVTVEQYGPQSYKTIFRVGVQYFTLTNVEDDEEALQHCTFIKDMFLRALTSLGVGPSDDDADTQEMTVPPALRE